MITINPFKAEENQVQFCRRTIFNLSSINEEYQLVSDKNLFVSVTPYVFRNIKGNIYSPLLLEADVDKIFNIFHHQGKFALYLAWTTIFTAISITLVGPLIDSGLTFEEMMLLFIGVDGGLFVLGFSEYFTFKSKAKKLGAELWERDVNIKLPKDVQKKVFLRTLKILGTSLYKSIIGEGIDVLGNDALKISHASFELGGEIITIVNKN